MSDRKVKDQDTELWVDQGERLYAPGETLTGGYRLAGWREEGVTAVELSVLWYTSGQGEEDLFVHHFERKREATLPARTDEAPNRFESVLPFSPLSYDGQIVKVCWAARLRGFFPNGKQRVIEAPFWLGLGARPGGAT
ncbi:hypothetical protein MalM25_20880 [Planctomycetes bacterium MalM25]|nr:hypothetical protein MalM25_20880 [Planctomycetes bacterium MalM25]